MDVKVTQTSYFGTVVNHFAVDVQHQFRHRVRRPFSLGFPARLGEVVVAEAADPGDPSVVGVVELGERAVCIDGVLPRQVVGGRTAEVEVVAHSQHADDHVRHPPRDGGERLRLRGRVWNRAQLRRLIRDLRGFPGPRVLMGDLNMAPPTPSRWSGLRPLGEAPTFPADIPDRQLDHILTDAFDLHVDRCVAPRLPVSDHRALVVEVSR